MRLEKVAAYLEWPSTYCQNILRSLRLEGTSVDFAVVSRSSQPNMHALGEMTSLFTTSRERTFMATQTKAWFPHFGFQHMDLDGSRILHLTV